MWPEEHDEQEEVAEDAEEDEEGVEDDHGDQQPGVGAEQPPQVGLRQVHRLVRVHTSQQLQRSVLLRQCLNCNS